MDDLLPHLTRIGFAPADAASILATLALAVEDPAVLRSAAERDALLLRCVEGDIVRWAVGLALRAWTAPAAAAAASHAQRLFTAVMALARDPSAVANQETVEAIVADAATAEPHVEDSECRALFRLLYPREKTREDVLGLFPTHVVSSAVETLVHRFRTSSPHDIKLQCSVVLGLWAILASRAFPVVDEAILTAALDLLPPAIQHAQLVLTRRLLHLLCEVSHGQVSVPDVAIRAGALTKLVDVIYTIPDHGSKTVLLQSVKALCAVLSAQSKRNSDVQDPIQLLHVMRCMGLLLLLLPARDAALVACTVDSLRHLVQLFPSDTDLCDAVLAAGLLDRVRTLMGAPNEHIVTSTMRLVSEIVRASNGLASNFVRTGFLEQITQAWQERHIKFAAQYDGYTLAMTVADSVGPTFLRPPMGTAAYVQAMIDTGIFALFEQAHVEFKSDHSCAMPLFAINCGTPDQICFVARMGGLRSLLAFPRTQTITRPVLTVFREASRAGNVAAFRALLRKRDVDRFTGARDNIDELVTKRYEYWRPPPEPTREQVKEWARELVDGYLKGAPCPPPLDPAHVLSTELPPPLTAREPLQHWPYERYEGGAGVGRVEKLRLWVSQAET